MSTLNLSMKPKGKSDPIQRVNLGLKKSVIDDIALYAEAYKATYDQEISDKDIINDVLANFFAREKGFQDWKKQRQSQPEVK
jgi:hypothetical protein